MRSLMRLVLLAAIGLVPVAAAGSLASAQEGSPIPVEEQLANCVPGRDQETPGDVPTVVGELPTNPGEDSTAPWALDEFGYFSWEGVCRPIAERGGTVPGELLEQLAAIAGSDEPSGIEELREELRGALDQGSGSILQPYAVGFKEEFAATRPIGWDEGDENVAEFMVVFVRQGTFVLDLYEDEQGVASQVLVASIENPEIEPQFPWDFGNDKPHYAVEGESLDCTTGCVVDPGQPLQLDPGDFAITQRGTLCLYCLAQAAEANGVLGALEVYALVNPEDLEQFSWILSWERVGQSESAYGTPSARVSHSPTAFGWAFPNLATGCKDH